MYFLTGSILYIFMMMTMLLVWLHLPRDSLLSCTCILFAVNLVNFKPSLKGIEVTVESLIFCLLEKRSRRDFPEESQAECFCSEVTRDVGINVIYINVDGAVPSRTEMKLPSSIKNRHRNTLLFIKEIKICYLFSTTHYFAATAVRHTRYFCCWYDMFHLQKFSFCVPGTLSINHKDPCNCLSFISRKMTKTCC